MHRSSNAPSWARQGIFIQASRRTVLSLASLRPCLAVRASPGPSSRTFCWPLIKAAGVESGAVNSSLSLSILINCLQLELDHSVVLQRGFMAQLVGTRILFAKLFVCRHNVCFIFSDILPNANWPVKSWHAENRIRPRLRRPQNLWCKLILTEIWNQSFNRTDIWRRRRVDVDYLRPWSWCGTLWMDAHGLWASAKANAGEPKHQAECERSKWPAIWKYCRIAWTSRVAVFAVIDVRFGSKPTPRTLNCKSGRYR